MIVIVDRNVNGAWYQAKQEMRKDHLIRPSRNGEVWEARYPVSTLYTNPTERVLFDLKRNANPFFHLFESLWMLAGRNDVKFLTQFVKRMSEFSDNGSTFHGAYGHRWRNHFGATNQFGDNGIDQLTEIVNMLSKNPEDRRAVLQMWDATIDLNKPTNKDLPCNTTVYFKVRANQLLMTVCNRSNDIVWGCYGANVVQFSMLQEYMAARIGVPVGHYVQMSDSWHAYTEVWNQYVPETEPTSEPLFFDPYRDGAGIRPYPLVDFPECFDEELEEWMARTEDPQLEERVYSNAFFPRVASPLFNAWLLHKEAVAEKKAAGKLLSPGALQGRLMSTLMACADCDWKFACASWLMRAHTPKTVETAAPSK